MNGLQIVERIALQIAQPIVQAEIAALEQRLSNTGANNQQIIAAIALQSLAPIIQAEMQALESRLTAKLTQTPAPAGSASNLPKLVATAARTLAMEPAPDNPPNTPVIVETE